MSNESGENPYRSLMGVSGERRLLGLILNRCQGLASLLTLVEYVAHISRPANHNVHLEDVL